MEQKSALTVETIKQFIKARGKWAEQISENGLRIKHKLKLKEDVSHIPVITKLRPEDVYDVIWLA